MWRTKDKYRDWSAGVPDFDILPPLTQLSCLIDYLHTHSFVIFVFLNKCIRATYSFLLSFKFGLSQTWVYCTLLLHIPGQLFKKFLAVMEPCLLSLWYVPLGSRAIPKGLGGSRLQPSKSKFKSHKFFKRSDTKCFTSVFLSRWAAAWYWALPWAV